MALVSRVLDSAEFGEETTPGTEAGTFTVNTFGDVLRVEIRVSDEVRVVKGIKGGSTGHVSTRLVDLKNTPVGSITFQPNSLQYYKYAMADFSSGGGTYTINNADSGLPTSLSIRGTYNDTDGVKLLGCYLNNFRFSLNDEDILTVTADIVALSSSDFTGTVSYVPPSEKPLIFSEGTVSFGGNVLDLQRFNHTFNPKFIQKWGIQTKSAGKKRYPSTILRGGKQDVTFDGVLNVDNISNELEVFWGGTSPQDQRTNITIIAAFTDDSSRTHTMTITGRTTEINVAQSDDEENSKTMDFTGVGLNTTISGDL